MDVQRDFESSYQEVTQQLVATNSDYGKRIADLCGGSASRPTTTNCGASGGQVFDTAQQLVSAYRRMENATAAIENAYAEIAIEQNRAAQQANLHNATAEMINEDGSRLEALAQRESDLEQMQGMLSGAVGFVGALSSGDYAGGVSGRRQHGDRRGGRRSKLDIEKERIRIDTVSKARVEYNQARSS